MQSYELLGTQWFGEDVSQLINCSKMVNLKTLLDNKITNKMHINLNKLGSTVEYWICRDINSTDIVAPDNCR